MKQTMKVLVSGSSGLVGSALCRRLIADGYEVIALSRAAVRDPDRQIPWNPDAQHLDATRLNGLDAVVHLAGENISSGRWTAAKKARIRDSRVHGTRLLAESLAGLQLPPRVLVCASAIAFYGDRGVEQVDEGSAAGTGFLADVCQQWEAAAQPVAQKGIRVVWLRIGVILSPTGGALAKMLLPFRMGTGGVVGTGDQYMSWISLDDAVGAIAHVLSIETMAGPVNAVTPHPVTNREFTKTLGRVLSRPTLFPMPAFAARLAFGEMADELLLASTRVAPQRLLGSGYQFLHPHLEQALRTMLGK